MPNNDPAHPSYHSLIAPVPAVSTGIEVTDDGLPPGTLFNRVGIALRHGTRYAFYGQARLAADVGVSRSTISRLIAGKTRPSLRLAQAVAVALSGDLGVPLDVRELFSADGTYPTRSGCAVCGCRGCLPEEAYDRNGSLRTAFRSQRPGDWTVAPPAPPRLDPSA